MRSYDLSKSNLVIGGVPIDATAAEGITFDSPGQDWSELVDVRGGVIRSRTAQGLVTATVSVIVGGHAHAHLSRLREADIATGRGVFQFYFRDWASGSEYTSRAAYIRQQPSVAYGQEASTTTFVIVMTSPRIVVNSIPNV